MHRPINILALWLSLLALSSCSKPRAFDMAQQAVVNHDLVALQTILARDGTLVSQGSGFDGSTLLHAALVNTPSFECAQLLLSKGADANKPDVTGEYPIHVICRFNGNEQCLELLLAHGADPTVRLRGRQTPVELAQEHGYTGAVKVLRKALSSKTGGPSSGSQPIRFETDPTSSVAERPVQTKPTGHASRELLVVGWDESAIQKQFGSARRKLTADFVTPYYGTTVPSGVDEQWLYPLFDGMGHRFVYFTKGHVVLAVEEWSDF